MMAKTLVGVRLSDATLEKLRTLARPEYYGTQTTVIEIAIDRLYMAEVGEVPLPGEGNELDGQFQGKDDEE